MQGGTDSEDRGVLLTPTEIAKPEEVVIVAEPPKAKNTAFEVVTILARAGSANHDYEDAHAVNPLRGTVAIADGATQACRSDVLANALTRYFSEEDFRLQNPPERELWWRLSRRRWFLEVGSGYSRMTAEEQDRYEKGGAGTFAGIRLTSPSRYLFYNCGDCCALWFRHGQLVRAEPENLAFNYYPDVLSTLNENAFSRLTVYPERPIPGDTLVMVTDALGEFFLRQRPWEREPGWWQWLPRFTPDDFEAWTEDAKRHDGLNDDDYTLIMVRFSEEGVQKAERESVAQGTPIATMNPLSETSLTQSLGKEDNFDERDGGAV